MNNIIQLNHETILALKLNIVVIYNGCKDTQRENMEIIKKNKLHMMKRMLKNESTKSITLI